MQPNLPGVQARHQQALDAGQFLIQHCGACQRHVYFPRELCPHCGAAAPEFVAPGGGGTLQAVTVISRKADEGGDYNVCMVLLDEGVKLMSHVVGADGVAPTALPTLQVGQRVRARVVQQAGKGLVVFELDGVAA